MDLRFEICGEENAPDGCVSEFPLVRLRVAEKGWPTGLPSVVRI